MTQSLPCQDEWLELLQSHRAGDPQAGRVLFERLYSELRRMAQRRLEGERSHHTLQPTSLVHEVFLRLEAAGLPELERSEFLRLSATVMRRVLIDSARRHRLSRRSPSNEPLPHPQSDPRSEGLLLRLDLALDRLAACDEPLMRVVELRFLAGLSVAETARVLGLSEATVKRDWRTARAFLQRQLEADDERS